MLTLRILMFVVAAPTLVGLLILVGLVAPVGLDDVTVMIGAVCIGLTLGVPVSIIVANILSKKA